MDAAAVTALAAAVDHNHASALMELLRENMELRQKLEQQRQELEQLRQDLDDATVPIQWREQWHHCEDTVV